MKNTMRIVMASTLVMSALATGCQTTTSVTKPAVQPITVETLEANNWRLIDAKLNNGDLVEALFFDPSRPLTLDFMTVEGRNMVSLMNTCNNMSAGYSVTNGEVELSAIRSTRMACPEHLAKFDSAAATTVQGKYSFGKNSDNNPVLVIKNDSQTAHFKAVPKTETL